MNHAPIHALPRRPLAPWEARVHSELLCKDPRLAAVWECWLHDFHCDVSGAQLRRFLLHTLGYEWIPSEQRVRVWLHRIEQVHNDHRPNASLLPHKRI